MVLRWKCRKYRLKPDLVISIWVIQTKRRMIASVYRVLTIMTSRKIFIVNHRFRCDDEELPAKRLKSKTNSQEREQEKRKLNRSKLRQRESIKMIKSLFNFR